MDSAADTDEESIESEFARTFRYIDLYMQQKTDLFLQHYVFEPLDLLFRRIMCLSVILTLLAAGTITLEIGVILFIATLVPLWAALLITGALIAGTGAVSAHLFFSHKIILKTPIALEMTKNGKP